jgi:hypothetical protein
MDGVDTLGKKLGLRTILRREQGVQAEAKQVSFVDSKLGQPLTQVHIFDQIEVGESVGGKKTCCELF